MTEDKLLRFMRSFAAAVQLAHRAAQNGFLVEYIILAASVVDACLRIGLILKHQIDTRSSAILEELLHQSDDDRSVSEREVYRRALEARVIEPTLFDKLQYLYSQRNRVVHRYVISDITTADVFAIARRYEEMIPEVNQAVWILERRQVELAVGMTQELDAEPADAEILDMANKKHGAEWLARAFVKRAT